MEKVSLFYYDGPGIKIYNELYFNEKNQLYFDGQDIGEIVKEAWLGHDDYEYTYTIEPEEVTKFYKIFGLKPNDKSGLLKEIQKRFSGNHSYTLFGEFMKKNQIKFEAFQWP